MSIDLEDWHQLVIRRFSGELTACSTHVEDQTERLLDLLDGAEVKATFFVLGLVAREKPDLIRRVAARGHEIASHGLAHVPFQRLGKSEIRRDLVDSRKLLSDIVGADVAGFRAPEFSIVEDNRWVLDEIAQAGYRYDSSVFPIVHRRYGIRSFVRGPAKLELESGPLWELPLGTMPTRLGNLPIAGGGYFRLAPGVALERAIRSRADRGEHVMLYFHPYEFTGQPLVMDESAMPQGQPSRLRANVWFLLQALGRSRIPPRVRRVLGATRTVRGIDLVDALDERTHADHAQH